MAFDVSLLNDLRPQLKGELRNDPLTLRLFSHDASILAVPPVAVYAPVDEEDLGKVVQFAAEQKLPLHARGAGTGIAGESLGNGLMLDFTRHFTNILETGEDWVRVQPGVVASTLASHLAKLGRRFAPDPASAATCTLGGMAATNASGARSLRHGYTRDHVLALRGYLASGGLGDFATLPLPQADASDTPLSPLLPRLVELLRAAEELVATCSPKTRFDRLGYLLRDVLTPEQLHLQKLLVGGEGTLALVTELKLWTIPLPAERCVALFGFLSLEKAAQCATLTLPAEPSACELLDRRCLSLACEADPGYEQFITPGVQAVLLVEFEADRLGEARRSADNLLHRMLPLRQHGLTMAHAGRSEEESAWLWRLRDLAAPLIHSLKGRSQPIPAFEDVAVLPEQLPEFLFKIQEILQRHQVTAAYLVHAGTGQVHARPFLDLAQPDDVDKLRKLSDQIHRLTLDLGGTVSTQHGTGLLRTPWVQAQYGRLAQVFKELKDLFDPLGILNPGKIVPAELGEPFQLLRPAATRPAEPIPLRLAWPEEDLAGPTNRCNSCGSCRTQDAGLRMCPIFRAEGDEAASPRAKANLLRDILGGALPIETLAGDELRAVANLCVNCKMCGQECPSKVPIPKLMLEAKAQNLAEEGFRWDDWVLARTETFAAFGSTFSWLTNRLLAARSVRWLMSKLLGISRRRKLPTFAAQHFLRRAARRGWTRLPRRTRGPKVAYFVDIYANYNDPEIAEATVAVLHHHGIEVYVPPGQTGCGMAPLAYGDVDTARTMARRNLNHLADLARTGYTIVCSEPTAALMLRQDYVDLMDENDTRLVAEHTTELTRFLADWKDQGKLRPVPEPLELRVGHHVPCHLKALQLGVGGPELLQTIPGMQVEVLDVSCSGMAGTFGFKESGFELSLAAGRPMLEQLGAERIHAGSTECSACRLQMEHSSSKPTLHPVQYLALGYGLLPKLKDRFLSRLTRRGR